MLAGSPGARPGIVIDNGPLKVAAAVLATLLYVGLVASQDSATFPGPAQGDAGNQPAGTSWSGSCGTWTRSANVARPSGRLGAQDFRPTVDLANLRPDGNPVNVRISVTAVDPRVSIVDVSPRSIPVVLDQLVSKTVPVTVDLSTPPAGLTVGDRTLSRRR